MAMVIIVSLFYLPIFWNWYGCKFNLSHNDKFPPFMGLCILYIGNLLGSVKLITDGLSDD